MKNTHSIAAALFSLTAAASLHGEAPSDKLAKFVVMGTDGPDIITVNDNVGVICGSPGVNVRSENATVLKVERLQAATNDCPGSLQGHQRWSGIDSKGNNYYTGNFGDGDDRYTRIDGPGNDRFEYNAGPGSDVITSTDGPGDDQYLYNNGAGNDFSVHDNAGITASGNEYYRIDGGPGTDRTVVLRDGPGNDRYEFHNAESVEFNDFMPEDQDTFQKIDDGR